MVSLLPPGMGRDQLALLGVGAAVGSLLTCFLSKREEPPQQGKLLPLASKGMAAKQGDRRAPTFFAGMIKCKPGMLDQYTALHDHTWGDELTLRALAAFFCVRVQVISSTSEEPVDIEPVEGAERLAERAVLYLGHFHEFHYVSLVRLT